MGVDDGQTAERRRHEETRLWRQELEERIETLAKVPLAESNRHNAAWLLRKLRLKTLGDRVERNVVEVQVSWAAVMKNLDSRGRWRGLVTGRPSRRSTAPKTGMRKMVTHDWEGLQRLYERSTIGLAVKEDEGRVWLVMSFDGCEIGRAAAGELSDENPGGSVYEALDKIIELDRVPENYQPPLF